jgi:hypothetical protein
MSLMLTIMLLHDVDAESCCRRCCRVLLAMNLPRRFDRGVMYMPSHTGDGATKVTWLQCDVDAKSCLRQYCRVILPMALPSPASDGDGTVKSCCQ